ncbi:MAG: peptidylprolyl isomerase [Nanoarchaeota archaeon]|nr:peptidylprolyl isomerase [Nanoarchaeota archaeon]
MIKRNDFLKIEFTGRIKDGDVFDSTRKEDLEKMHSGHNHSIESQPFIFCIGHKMFLGALEDFLIGKELGKDYEVELSPEDAFGKRESSLIQRIPLKVFRDQKLNPVQGASFNFDGRVGRVLAVSGGRVMTDFNHPLSGKNLVYTIRVIETVNDLNEKIQSLNDFFFKKKFKFEVKDKNLFIEADENYKKFIELFKDKYKELIGLDVEVKKSLNEGKNSE